MPASAHDPIYLDHAATTPIREEVLEAMTPFLGRRFGNPSSTHRWGREARAALDGARERLARTIGAKTDEICFTSGGTEADNMAVLGIWRAMQKKGRPACVSTPIEHKAVLGAVHQVEAEGGEVRMLSVSGDGSVDVASARGVLRDDVAVCSMMWVNNETGVIQPVAEVSRLAKEAGAIFHTDAVQAFGKVEIDASRQQFDVLSLSGHKICAPKGIGALFIRRGTPIDPLMHGGSQDRGRRPGTENVAAAVGLARAAELIVAERGHENERLRRLRDELERAILERVPDAVVHGRNSARAPHILSISVPGTDSESLLMALDLKGVAASGGSACQSGSVSGSHVLKAMRVRPDLAGAVVRMSLGCLTTDDCVRRVTEVFPALVAKARSMAGSAAS
ncbi:MAG: cysteine desulfurase [Gemmatimonadaceae bacterium]|nr:cysteine desulfurase [Gemmatimonadaceae bacterium]